MPASRTPAPLRSAPARRNAAAGDPAGEVLRKLRVAEAGLRAVADNLPCVVFALRRRRSGSNEFLHVGTNSEKLLHVDGETLRESFAAMMGVLDSAEYARLEECIAVAAARRGELKWEGKLRTRKRQRAKWIRLQAQKPKIVAGAAVWQGTISDISREHDLDQSLRRSREQLSELSSYLEAGKEEERERIARDIHDELGSLLVAIKIEASLLTSKLSRTQTALRDKARSIETMLDQAMGTASRVARELRPGILKEFGLPAAIECQAEDFSLRTGISCRAQCEGEGIEVEERAALAVFRIVQEALTNVAKHAHASLVAIRLYRDRQQLIVEIRDNGRGIGDTDMHKPKSFGLRGIRERVRSLNGELSIGAGEQGGTHIVLSLPLKSAGRRARIDEDAQRKLF